MELGFFLSSIAKLVEALNIVSSTGSGTELDASFALS